MGSYSQYIVSVLLVVVLSQVRISMAGNYDVRGLNPGLLKNSVRYNGTTAQTGQQQDAADKVKGGNYARAAEQAEKPNWEPNTAPYKSSFQVIDNIHGADQFREEQMKDGVMSGYWATPVDDSKKTYRVMTYTAGKDGFKIVKDEVVPREKLTEGKNPSANEAHVGIQNQGGNIDYTVKESDLKKAQQDSLKQH